MTYNTINDAATMQPGAEGTLLAGRYRVVRQLGQGGMGSVWLAEDTQLDGKLFAIKMLPSILVSNKRAYRQLKDEALVAMKLTHPNIVTLRAFEENNGNPFLVMDYVDGQTLDDYLAEYDSRVEHVERVEGDVGRDARPARPSGGLPEDEVVRLLKPIAAALDYAHGEGVVHRDVKPANVMIRKDGHPFILDFGIAREIQETMTRVTGKLSSGTLLYMSPEQLRGQSPKPAQDVYSFAAMAYECLKGEPPFSRGQVEYQILNEQPEPLGPHFAKSGSVMQGLAKKPEDRPKTCAAVLDGDGFSRAEHVERVEGEGGAGAQRPPTEEDIGRKSSKFLGRVVGIIAFLAALAGGMWWMKEWTEGTDRTDGTDSPPIAPVPSPKADDAEEWAKAEAAKIRDEAKEWQNKISRISDDDVLFGRRKNALADLFARAEAHFDEKVGNWREAAQGFTNYVAQCEELQKLNGEWLSAKESRDKAVEAKNRAKTADAEKYAPFRWNKANELMEKGDNDFTSFRFAESDASFASAAEQFGKCELEAKDERTRRDEAKKDRERQEREAEEKAQALERKRQAALQKILNDPLQYENVIEDLTEKQRLKLTPIYENIVSTGRRRRQLLIDYTENHPDVIATKKKLDGLASEFKEQVELFAGSVGVIKRHQSLPIAEHFKPTPAEVQAARTKQFQSLVGKWRGSYVKSIHSKTTKGQESSQEHTVAFEWEFRSDGTFRADCTYTVEWFIMNGSKTSSASRSTGNWVLSGDRLTIRNCRNHYNDKVVSCADYSYVVLWRSDGSLEMQIDVDEFKKKVDIVDAYYESDGTFKYSSKFSRKSHIEGLVQCSETPHVFKRVSD